MFLFEKARDKIQKVMMMTRRVKWALLGAGSGATGLHFYRCKKDFERENPPVTLQKYMILRTLPMHSMSSMAGFLAELPIPTILRRPLFASYAKLYNVNIDECDPLTTFSSFQSFFTRPLKSGSRSVDRRAKIVSPCDGTVVKAGIVDSVDGRFEAVKGVQYNLSDLLGEERARQFLTKSKSKSAWWWPNKDTNLYYMTIYLAPGDYHRFHSPSNMTITSCDQHEGMKLPVSPTFLTYISPDTLRLNSRATIYSQTHGVALVPVGALNVSSIDIFANTNEHVKKGDLLGQFKLGSTVILFFTGDAEHIDQIPRGKIKMGQRIY